MENFKFILLSIVVLGIMTLVGYWAIFTIEPGNIHAYKQKQKQLEEKNKELESEVAKLKSEIGALETLQVENSAVIESEETPPVPTGSASALKHQSLINDLQKLIDDGVFMKEKSIGTRVGTVQTFLNIYNNTSKRVDNEYGPGTKTDVINFQKAVGLTADGEAGPATFRKMIEWLKKQ